MARRIGRPFLFVLDEATSAIDVPAERKIIKAMLDLKPRPTIVMIAHRDQSLAACDRMLRLQNGRAIADQPASGLLRGLLHGWQSRRNAYMSDKPACPASPCA
jgi:ABC-type bacteriocin/lantibiotic exporter with double-glycine peptidase domain